VKKFITAATTLVAVGAALAVSAPAAQAQGGGYYGAIATGNDGRWSITNNYNGFQEAEGAAVRTCGHGSCSVLLSWRNGCAVLVARKNPRSTTWQASSRSNYTAARDAALARLAGSSVVTWRCTNGYS
jgi:choline dehydrogenase-like flavoprotein